MDVMKDGLRDTVPYQGATTFMRAPSTRDLDGVDIAVYGIPLDLGTINRPGARLGPRAIREQSLLTCGFGSIWPHDYELSERVKFIDYGDLSFTPGYIDDMLEVTGVHLRKMIDAGISTLGLGGDHLIAYPELYAHAQAHGPLSLIHFDAHADNYESDRLNHGSMFWFAADEGLIDPKRSVQVGIRTPWDGDNGFTVLSANECNRMSSDQIVARIRDVVGDSPCFVSLDVDGMDPAYTPGTGTPVPGGITSMMQREILWGLKGINAVGGDVVEVSPPYDHNGATAIVASYVAADILYLLAENRRNKARQ